MSFLITVAVPRPGDNWDENKEEMKEAGMQYIPERKCWIGEVCSDAYDDVMTVVGEFVCESLHPSEITRAQVVKKIDSCADFKKVGR